MSIQSITSQITSIDRDIKTFKENIQIINNNISRKHKETNDLLIKISKEKDLKKVITYQKDFNRKNDEIRKTLIHALQPRHSPPSQHPPERIRFFAGRIVFCNDYLNKTYKQWTNKVS